MRLGRAGARGRSIHFIVRLSAFEASLLHDMCTRDGLIARRRTPNRPISRHPFSIHSDVTVCLRAHPNDSDRAVGRIPVNVNANANARSFMAARCQAAAACPIAASIVRTSTLAFPRMCCAGTTRARPLGSLVLCAASQNQHTARPRPHPRSAGITPSANLFHSRTPLIYIPA